MPFSWGARFEGFRISYILEWWYLQRHRGPTLSQFAIEILSIPAMSDDIERVFSGARRTISWERAKLGINRVEAVECLNSWFSIDLERLSQLLSDQEDQEGEEDSETEG